MTDSGISIRSQAARFSAGGASRGRGMVLLYPDRLAAVITPTDTFGYLVGPAIYAAVALPLFHTIGWLGIAAGSAIGGGAGNAILKRRAIRKAAAGGDGVTVIPLDQVTGVRTRKPAGIGGWWGYRVLAVTTADGVEYGFHGIMEKWQAHLARALTARGRQVHTVPEGITVALHVAGEEDLRRGWNTARLSPRRRRTGRRRCPPRPAGSGRPG